MIVRIRAEATVVVQVQTEVEVGVVLCMTRMGLRMVRVEVVEVSFIELAHLRSCRVSILLKFKAGIWKQTVWGPNSPDRAPQVGASGA